jgi:hypothetical protein
MTSLSSLWGLGSPLSRRSPTVAARRITHAEEDTINDTTRTPGPSRRAMSRRTRAAAAAVVGLALLTAACGGSPASHVAQLGTTTTSPALSSGSSSGGGSTNSAAPTAELLAFSNCMRSQGLPNFPDPNSSGVLPKVQLVQVVNSNPRYAAAAQVCRHLLPNGVPGSQPTQAQTLQTLSELRSFSQCMRSHGERSWPDPTLGPDERPTFNLPAVIAAHAAINSNGEITSPHISSKMRECEHVLPAGEYLPPFSPSGTAAGGG